ncbi:MAG: MFS transporter [Acidiferrobacterales bacterium]
MPVPLSVRIDRGDRVPTGLMDNRRAMVFLALARTCRSIAAGMLNLAFPYYILTRFPHGVLVIGFIFIAATLAGAVLSLLVGIGADVWGRRGTLVVANLLLPLSAIMVYLSHSLWLIVPAAMLGGYSSTGSLGGGGVGGVAQPVQSVVLANLTSYQERTKYFSLFTFLAGVAGALGALLARVLEVRDIFLVAAIISAAGIPLLWCIKVDASRGKLVRLKTRATIGKFTLTGMLNGFAQGLVVPFLIPFFILVYHLPKSEMSVFAFSAGLLASLSLLGAPLLERRLGFLKSILITRGTGLLLFLVFPIIRFLPLSAAIYIVAPALRVAGLPIQQSELTKRVDEDEMGRALGINRVARLIATSAGIGVSGHLFDAAHFEIPFFLYGLVMAGNLLLYMKFFGAGRWPENGE